MKLDERISRKSFLKGSVAMTVAMMLGSATNLVSAAEADASAQTKADAKSPEKTAMQYLFDRTPFEPVQVFDNLYYIGSISVAQFVVRTSKGLILIDSGWDEKDADYAAASMKKLGLDPAATKYILLTHGHSDHYGGAQFFKDKYSPKAKIAMNIVDSHWDAVIPCEKAFSGVRPKLDMGLDDQQDIVLGDTSVHIVLTPGHTPGCVSMIIPVNDHGEPHKVAIWGGTGTPANLEMNYLYLSAVDYFAQFTGADKVDVEMSAHGWVDDTFARLEQLKKRQPGQPHPFVIGQEKYREYEQTFRTMAEKAIEKYRK